MNQRQWMRTAGDYSAWLGQGISGAALSMRTRANPEEHSCRSRTFCPTSAWDRRSGGRVVPARAEHIPARTLEPRNGSAVLSGC